VIRIRPAREDEAEAILGLWGAGQTTASSTDDVAAIRELVRHDPEALLLAESDGRLVGTLIVGWDGWRGGMYRLVVVPDMRRTGIGTQLVRAAEARLRGLGSRRVAAVVMREHQHANAFWLAMGYRHDDRVGRWVRDLPAGPYTR
jgi:ribosomal protein S18 acetylase RimI-like enzyme